MVVVPMLIIIVMKSKNPFPPLPSLRVAWRTAVIIPLLYSVEGASFNPSSRITL